MNTRVTRRTVRRSPGLLLAVALCMPLLALADDAAQCDSSPTQVRLITRVKGVNKASGNVTITVYPNESSRFLAKGGKLARQRVTAVAPTTSACFVLPQVGAYAVAVYHDANDDHAFNRTFIGMPNEGYGFSRNPKTTIGLPSLSEVRVAATPGDNVVEIQLTYP